MTGRSAFMPAWFLCVLVGAGVALLSAGEGAGDEKGKVVQGSRGSEPGKPPAKQSEIPNFDEEMLLEHKVATDPAALIRFLKERSDADEDLLNLEVLVAQLGHDNFGKREEAEKKLMRLGLVALRSVSVARHATDKELARRAAGIVDCVQRDNFANLPLAAIRSLVKLKGDGTVEALLRYLPYAVDEDLEEEIYYGLEQLGCKEGKLHPALVEALGDKIAARRAVAGCIVGHLGNEAEKSAVRKLLEDKDPYVRLRSAQGLMAARDDSGVATLISLLDVAPISVAWQAEELLYYVAGEDGPEVRVGADESRKRDKVVNAWRRWWDVSRAAVSLETIEGTNRRPRMVLVGAGAGHVLTDPTDAGGVVALLGSGGRRHWELKIPGEEIVDARLIATNRLLLHERHDSRSLADDKDRENTCLRDLGGSKINEMGDWSVSGYVANETVWGVGQRKGNGRLNFVIWNLLDKENSPLLDMPYKEEAGNRSGDCPIPSQFSLPIRMPSGRFLKLENGTDRAQLVEVDPASKKVRRTLGVRLSSGQPLGIALHGNDLLFCTAKGEDTLLVRHTGEVEAMYSLWQAQGIARNLDCVGISLGGPRLRHAVIVNCDNHVIWEGCGYRQMWSARECLRLVGFGFARVAEKYNLNSFAEQVTKLGSRHAETRLLALETLRQDHITESSKMLATIIDSFGDCEPMVSDQAVALVVDIGQQAFPETKRAWGSKGPRVRARCTYVFQRLGTDEALGLLRDAVSDKDGEVRMQAAHWLGALGPKAAFALPELIRALKDEGPNVAAEAAWTLGRIGPLANEAVDALLEAINTPNQRLRGAAAGALGDIGVDKQEVIDALGKCAGDKQNARQTRWQAAGALGDLGKPAASKIPVLISCLHEPVPTGEENTDCLQPAAIRSLVRVGAQSPAVVDELLAVLQDQERAMSIRIVAVQELENVRCEIARVRKALKELQGTADDPGFRQNIKNTLAALEGKK